MSIYTISKKRNDILNKLTQTKTLFKNTQYFCNKKFTEQVIDVLFESESFEHVAFMNVTFINCKFAHTIFEKCAFINCRFSHCKFKYTNFSNSLSNGHEFEKCEFTCCGFLGIYILDSASIQFVIHDSLIDSSYFKDWNITSNGANKLVKFNCDIFTDSHLSFSSAQSKYMLITPYCMGYYSTCPETGSYIAYKYALVKTRDNRNKEVIVKLQILENAKRSSAGGRKCRASAAKVLSISSIDYKTYYKKAFSNWHNDFIYEVGKIVTVSKFDTNRWEECSTGIHHFLTRQEAVAYALM